MSQERDPRPDVVRAARVGEDGHGRDATRPQEIPRAGWKDILLRVKDGIKRDQIPLVAAGVAFYAMLALFPAMTALISLYGLVADPQQIQQQIDDIAGDMEGGAGDLISEQAQTIAGAGTGALTTGLAISIVAALWAASSGMQGLMLALTIANNEEESRGLIKKRAIALGLTLVAIIVVILAMGVIVVVPVILQVAGLGQVGEWLVRILRWPLMGLVVVGVLASIYRIGPDRDQPKWRWVSPGAVVATVLWVLASIAFSVYVNNFGDYNETYGALGAVIVLLLWLFISAFVVLFGAELNAEMEHQTAEDTTAGDPQPMGQRDAEVADHVADRPD